MMGLHPTSVKENFSSELGTIETELQKRRYSAIGEIGIDLYWDKTFVEKQKEAFQIQIKWAKELNLPIVIHARESFDEIFEVLDNTWEEGLTGVFHSFSGNRDHAQKALSYNFHIGINGIVTFKNNDIADVVSEIPLDRILLETDAPFLAPVPFRGKRNESSYLLHIAERISELHKLNIEEVAEVTTNNALNLFNILS
jgi:TatD DNase family protein